MAISDEAARVQAWAARLRTKQRALVEESRPDSSVEPEHEKVAGAFDFDLLETNAPTGRAEEDHPAEGPTPPRGSHPAPPDG